MLLLAQESLFTGIGAGALGSLVFGVIGILILVLGYKFFDKITPNVDIATKLNENNVAVAVVVSAFILGVAYVAAHAIN